MKKSLSIVVPAYNEEGNIPALVGNLSALRDKHGWDCEIVIVNDNSSDATGDVAERLSGKVPNVRVIHRKKGDNGMGHALIDGTKKASGDYVVWVMADNSDNLDSIAGMVDKLSESYDMVIGSRYMKGGSRGELSMDKAFLGKGYTFVSRLLFGIPVNDLTNAFRGFKKEVFETVQPKSGDFAISPEFSLRAHKKGYKVTEVPTTYYSRKAGKANFKMLKMGARYVSMFKHRFTD